MDIEPVRLSRLGKNQTFLTIAIVLVLSVVPAILNMVSVNRSQENLNETQNAILRGVTKTNELLELINAQRSNTVDMEGMKIILKATLENSKSSIISASMIILEQDELYLDSRQSFVKMKVNSLVGSLYRSDLNELGIFYYKGNPLSLGITRYDPSLKSQIICDYLFTKYTDVSCRANLIELLQQDFNSTYEDAITVMTAKNEK
jgi:hypothetical protein